MGYGQSNILRFPRASQPVGVCFKGMNDNEEIGEVRADPDTPLEEVLKEHGAAMGTVDAEGHAVQVDLYDANNVKIVDKSMPIRLLPSRADTGQRVVTVQPQSLGAAGIRV